MSAALPIILPLGLPVTTTHPTRMAFEFVENLKPGDVVWLSFDYGPTSAPENDPMAEGFMRHCFSRNIKVVVSALYGLGGLGLANSSIARLKAEFPEKEYGVDYVNLGYKDGSEAVMRRLGDNIAGAFPRDVRGTPISRFPIFDGVRSIRQVKVVFTAATGPIGEYWVTLMNAQSGTPVIAGPTAVNAPKFYAFLNSRQLAGMLGGMKGAAEYEQLLSKRYPKLERFYKSTRSLTATRAMDVQTSTHAVIVLFIVMGNIGYFAQRRRARRAGLPG